MDRRERDRKRDTTFGPTGDPGSLLAKAVGGVIPQAVAQRAVRVSLSVDAKRHRRGDPVELTVEFTNRLPVPVAVRTPRSRLWGWSVDGRLEASAEPRYEPEATNEFRFLANERKRATWRWNGRVTDTDGHSRWASPGEHVVRAFLAVDTDTDVYLDVFENEDGNGTHPADSVVVELV